MAPSLTDIEMLVPEQKATWAALRGSLTHSKFNLTQKLNEELESAEKLKPSAQSGPGSKVQNVIAIHIMDYSYKVLYC